MPAESHLERTGGAHAEEYAYGDSSEVGLDSSFVTRSLDDSIYLPVPQKEFKNTIRAAPVPMSQANWCRPVQSSWQ